MISVLNSKLDWEHCSEQSPPFDGTPLQAVGRLISSRLPVNNLPRAITSEKGLTR